MLASSPKLGKGGFASIAEESVEAGEPNSPALTRGRSSLPAQGRRTSAPEAPRPGSPRGLSGLAGPEGREAEGASLLPAAV